MLLSAHPLDLLLLAVLAIGLPIEGRHAFHRLVAAVRAGRPHAKVRAYRATILIQWSLVIALVTGWTLSQRSWAALGLSAGSAGGALVGVIGVGVVAAFVVMQQESVAALSADRRDRARAGLGDVLQLLPSRPDERRWFNATAVTAGICEELLYRGFLMWYLAPLGNWGAMLTSSAMFGFAHFYQGWRGILKTTAIGVVLAGVYLVTGTLWAPMIIHALLDLSAGAISRTLAQQLPSPD
jgi:membrane protease YdiL (CAAX protease family)